MSETIAQINTLGANHPQLLQAKNAAATTSNAVSPANTNNSDDDIVYVKQVDRSGQQPEPRTSAGKALRAVLAEHNDRRPAWPVVSTEHEARDCLLLLEFEETKSTGEKPIGSLLRQKQFSCLELYGQMKKLDDDRIKNLNDERERVSEFLKKVRSVGLDTKIGIREKKFKFLKQ